MAKQQDSKTELRMAYTRRELKKAKYNFPGGSIGVFMRVTLATTFMYLILIGYTMMGTFGLVFISLSFLLALFSPILYRVARELLSNRKKLDLEDCAPLAPEMETKG